MNSLLIIGSGIVGASAAYHAAKAGAEVTVIDRKEKGQATGAAAGIVCPWLSQRRNQAWYTLVKNGAAYYPELIRNLVEDGSEETGYKKTGLIVLNDDNKLTQIEERALKWREDAPEIGEIRRLTEEETAALYPPASAESFRSLYIEGAARVDGRALRDALVRSAEKHGARFLSGDAELIVEGGCARGVRTRDGELLADRVIVAAGAWAAELFEPLGFRFAVTPQKAQILHLRVASSTADWPVVMGLYGQYVVPFDDGRIVVGATHENKAGFDRRLTAGGVHDILDKAFAASPGLRDAELIEARVGFRPLLPDSVTALGSVPGTENLFTANGLGSSGLTAGPFAGAQLAKLALGLPPDIETEQYDVSRFMKKY